MSCTLNGVTLVLTMRSPSTFSPKGFFLKKVEAAGIEPASRDISMEASTCVVGSFPHFALGTPTDGVPFRLAGNGVLTSGVPNYDPRRFGISDRLLGLSDEDPQSGLPLFRRPKRSYLQQLKILVGF